jgi:hypothetical protein
MLGIGMLVQSLDPHIPVGGNLYLVASHRELPAIMLDGDGRGCCPKDAVIMAVAPNPGAPGARMVLVRIRKEIPQVLADFQKLYVTAGWVCDGPPDPKAQPDEGWLMRFSKGNRERVIYARPRRIVGETLVAIYDAPL